jgi:hypothetical protein
LTNSRRIRVATQKLPMTIAIVLISSFALSCTTVQQSQKQKIYLANIPIDSLECIGLSLRMDVHVKAEIIHEPSIMYGRYLIVLRYREGGDERAYTADLKAGYNNVSLVSEVAANDEKPLIIYRRYCVVEMWKFYPDEEMKSCSIWTIEAASASMKVMLERIDGEFIDERIVHLTKEDVDVLKDFYKHLTQEILDRLEGPVPIA